MMRIAIPLPQDKRPDFDRLIQIYRESTKMAADALARYDTDGTADLMATEKNNNATAALHAIRVLYGLESPTEPTRINATIPGGFKV